MQHPVPNMWEVVLPNISVEGGIVHPYVHGLLYGPGQAVSSLPIIWKFSIVVSWPLLS